MDFGVMDSPESYKPQTVSAWMERRQSTGLVLVGKWYGCIEVKSDKIHLYGGIFGC